MACESGNEGQRAFCRGSGKDGWGHGQIAFGTMRIIGDKHEKSSGRQESFVAGG